MICQPVTLPGYADSEGPNVADTVIEA